MAADAPLLALPDELLVQVVSHLGVRARVRCSETCKRLWGACWDPSVWKVLRFKLPHKSPDTLARRCWQVERLDFSHCPNRAAPTSVHVSPFFEHCPNLRVVDVSWTKIAAPAVQAMSELQHLTHLSVAGTRIGDAQLQTLASLPSLCNLDANHCMDITDVGIRSLTSAVGHQLLLLHLDDCTQLSRRTPSLIARHCPALQSLELDGEGLEDADVEPLFRACSRLEHLRISFCQGITDAALVTLAEHNTSLKEVVLRKGEFGLGEGVQTLVKRCPLITLFHLPETRINNAIVVCLATGCKELQDVDLSWCMRVGDEGVGALITRCPKIKEMKLTGLKDLTSAPLESLHSCLPALRMLDLTQCDAVNDTRLLAIKRARPPLVIVNYYGSELRA